MWKTVKLRDVVCFDKKNGKDSGLPYVGMENIASESMQLVGTIEIPETTSSSFEFDETHVLYGRLRPYLKKVLLPNFKGQCSTEVFCLKPSKVLLRGYLAYWLLNPSTAAAIEQTSTGARMPRANMNAILDFQFQLPPLPEQERIVAKLDAAFAEIDEAVEVVQQQMLQTQSLQQQKIDRVFGVISGDKKTLNDVCNLITCGVAARPEYVEEGIPFLSAQNVKKGQVLYYNHKYITKEKHQELTKKNKPKRGDLLYTRVGSFGEAAVVESDIEFSIFVSLTLIKTKNELNPYYLKHYLNSQRLKKLASNSLSGSGVGNLNVGTVRKFPITLPSIKQQLEVVENLNDLADRTERLYQTYQRKSANLQSLKSAILSQELQPSEVA